LRTALRVQHSAGKMTENRSLLAPAIVRQGRMCGAI